MFLPNQEVVEQIDVRLFDQIFWIWVRTRTFQQSEVYNPKEKKTFVIQWFKVKDYSIFVI